MDSDHKLSALVVDDQPDIREMFQRVFRDENIFCETAANGREGLEKIMKRSYDVVFLDLVMPELDGESLLALIHRYRPSVHTVVMSVQDDEGVINEMMAMGAKAYMLKPFQADDIMEIVRNVKHHRTTYEVDGASWELPGGRDA